MKKHTISVLVENKFGVLARVAGLFSGRGYNIESLSVNTTENPKISRMTIVTSGDDRIIEQIDKQVSKLIDVIKVIDFTSSGNFIERELLLMKVKTTAETRSQIIELVEIFEGKIVCVGIDEIGIELSGRDEKISDFIELVRPFGIIEMSRTGRAAISKPQINN
ncbi:MAG TPA: acetolactate synthase small subunit [Victivallales bacterium]|nr:acetolactate synthase small subunit [Victivallales bacterium]HRU01373.1 acetolactate synthase small subunit [Victivallales bacterium]